MLGGLITAAVDAADANGNSIDIPAVLRTYNDRRLEDARAACLLSEEGFGGARSTRPRYMAELATIQILHKTLGRIAPKVGPKGPKYLLAFVCGIQRVMHGVTLHSQTHDMDHLTASSECPALAPLPFYTPCLPLPACLFDLAVISTTGLVRCHQGSSGVRGDPTREKPGDQAPEETSSLCCSGGVGGSSLEPPNALEIPSVVAE